MTNESNDNQRANELLQRILKIWTTINTDENGDTYTTPGSRNEVERSRNILDEVDTLDLSDVDVMKFYDSIDETLEVYEDAIEQGEEVDYSATDESNGAQGEPAPDPNESTTMFTQADQKAWDILEKIYGSWSDISVEDGEEYRKPDSKSEIKKSRTMLSEAKSLHAIDNDVKNRIVELEGVLDSMGDAFPNYWWRIIVSLIISVGFFVALFYQLNNTEVVAPSFDFDQEWFTTNKTGYLLPKPFLKDDKVKELKNKIQLIKGTELTPIATMGSRWIQVKTADNQIGFVDHKILKGSRYVVSKSYTKGYKKVGGKEFDSINGGLKFDVLEAKAKNEKFGNQWFFKVKLENGKMRWIKEFQLRFLIHDSLPRISQSRDFFTNKEVIEANVIGKPLTEIELRYGPAASHLNIDGDNRAYFRDLIIVDSDTHHYHNSLVLDDSNIVTQIAYGGKGITRFYDIFPFLNFVRGLELDRTSNSSYYVQETKYEFTWGEKFKEKNWFTWIIYWIAKILFAFAALFFLFSIPRIVVNPILQFFTFTRYFHNGIVAMVDAVIIIIASYFYFLSTILMMEQWVIPIIGFILVTSILVRRHLSNIWYNRCPACLTMYSAIDEGSTHTGRDTSISWGTWTKDKGKTETSTTITHHTETRSTKTTTHVDHYLDHRMCARCYYEWDVDRDEEEETKNYL